MHDRGREEMTLLADEQVDRPIGVAFVDGRGEPGWIRRDPALRVHHPTLRGCFPTIGSRSSACGRCATTAPCRRNRASRPADQEDLNRPKILRSATTINPLVEQQSLCLQHFLKCDQRAHKVVV